MKNFVGCVQTWDQNERRRSKRASKKRKIFRNSWRSDFMEETKEQCNEILKIFLKEEKKSYTVFIGKKLRYAYISSIILF